MEKVYTITKTERISGIVLEVWNSTESELRNDCGRMADKLIETGAAYIPGWGIDYTAVSA
jgi:hypothetical protein